ncbi:MAG: hypothetical protein KatS3mg110_0953 [Pirellulaceae bacterium]|nr:MAG: hypothetical protein KatS3mg110_0953 [Pirellulaceae bacterium]
MPFFGMSEAEIKKKEKELETLRDRLEKRESELRLSQSKLDHEKALLEEAKNNLDAEREAFREEVRKQWEAIASEKNDLEERRHELAKLEAQAKAGFVEKQREAFKEVIERRMAELDARQKDLEGAERELAQRYEQLHIAEADLARRELAVTEREQKADAGFADKAKALADEAARQHQANQAEAERLRAWAESLAKQHEQLEAEKAQLLVREQAIRAAEQERDAGFSEERAKLDAELRAKRAQVESELSSYREQQFIAIEQELSKVKTRRLEEIAEAEKLERERIRTEIEQERVRWKEQQEQERKQLDKERTEIEKQKGALHALQSELEGRLIEIERIERRLEREEQRLEERWQKRREELDDELEALIDEERKSMEMERQSLIAENQRLRESLRIQLDLVAAFDQLKQQLGDRDPAEILRELDNKTDELMRLREDLASRPTEEIRHRYEQLQSENEKLKARIDDLTKQINDNADLVAQASELRRRKSELEFENQMLGQKVVRLEGAFNEAQAELERLRAAYERPAELQARYKEIELPYITADKIPAPRKDDQIEEIDWLEEIEMACTNYGLHFHPRILKAFHTALKTAEWTPLTVLAGVSGTGKSELPRLYSHFGGLMFAPVSVQPNWDSQESMLGFFNSIDNRFDAQPVLRFLAQSQKPWINPTEDGEGYPGLRDAMCLVLLDEMNLAHPELYFAEFLSKLELRRGMKGSDVPALPVKIGAGMPPYRLPLGRNVLWVGTMNQDETTKSLSDKVLDRSIIIYFPRPTVLKRRFQLSALDEKNRGPLLHKRTWQSWLAQGTLFTEDEIKPYKAFIEEMNRSLGVAGRAIGHRVWQSVEYYMANYPNVRAAKKANDKDALEKALHVAFEDQLVQKVMPKLRGIDTRGKTKTDCLDKILAQINTGIGGNPFHLAEDFELACELGYGQFIWQSANYLKDEFTEETV